MEFSNVVTIRSRRDVFEFVSDLENVPKWNYAIVETRKTSPGPIAVGSTYRQVIHEENPGIHAGKARR